MIPTITGVTMPSRTVLSVTWPEASMLPFPGGTIGSKTRTTSGVAITLASSQRTPTRRR